MIDFVPTTTAEMVFSDNETKKLINDLLSHRVTLPAHGKNSLILFGVFGSGKTTYAKIFFDEYERSFNGDTAFVTEFVVDSSEKITTTINKISQIADKVPLFNHSNKHYFFFDEFDNYQLEQQARLKHFLNRNNIICIMTTNNLHKIDEGIKSRSHVINFNASSNIDDYVERMRQIIKDNNLPNLSYETLKEIAEESNGSWREMSYLLEQCCNKVKPKLTLVKSF